MDDGERGFTQGSICLLLPALAMLNTLPDNVVLLHSALGCGSCTHSQNANVRMGGNARWGKAKDGIWLSTALDETDVISGGEAKLEQAIIEADRRYRPATITIVAGCVPGIIGDDIDGVAQKVQPQVNARLLPVHCEGFKTKIWATAYDAVYHTIGRNLLEERGVPNAGPADELAVLREQERLQAHRQPDERLLHGADRRAGTGAAPPGPRPRGERLSGLLPPGFASSTPLGRRSPSAPARPTTITSSAICRSVSACRPCSSTCRSGSRIRASGCGTLLPHSAQEEQVERLIAVEEAELKEALREFRPLFAGKRVFVSAGEFRALATARLLQEIGFEVVGIRSFHHDRFAEGEYEKLAREAASDYVVDIANVQPFEEANLLKRLKPDLFLGHANGNMTAAKLGIPTHVIYNTGAGLHRLPGCLRTGPTPAPPAEEPGLQPQSGRKRPAPLQREVVRGRAVFLHQHEREGCQ